MERVRAAVAAAVSACIAGPALAGGAQSSSSFNWSGFYVGGQIGYNWADADHRFRFPGDGQVYSTSNKLDGVVGGAYAGMNWQSPGRFVFGVEADIIFRDQADQAPLYVNGAPYSPGFNGFAQVDWSVGVRGRIGYAVDRFLPYITVGGASERVKYGYTWNNGVSGNKGRDTMFGLTLGAGIEYAVTNNFIARIDYRYSDFDGKTLIIGDDATSTSKMDLDSHDLLFGVAYKF